MLVCPHSLQYDFREKIWNSIVEPPAACKYFHTRRVTWWTNEMMLNIEVLVYDQYILASPCMEYEDPTTCS